ncbi:hypothetical protein QP257_24745, partial [Escherichia coli]|nr:hypothetical protein [Escherichia coli]
MAFPSSAPAAEKIAEKMSGAERYDVFYTPMAIATFDNILQALERENVARQQGTTWQVDMAALATMQHDNVRWRDFAENDYP